ncbi:SufE family protein [Nitratireductor kimnyeongensis]|uniref:SufE family protein n=1 Tax=Nitratireductor kimnyeongensis TaxID=430679 RepID=A0ABW0T4U4_9HYPH|nr:SufE family protein [Nitratireductor kimnyeongensis]QZZ34993.1 SufE family protein [Nitratireductor kimnyeongensis]
MSTTIDTLYDDFAFLDDWEERYRYIIDLGNNLPSYPETARDEAHRVRGCVSQVWLQTDRGEGSDPVLTFKGDSDAHIVRGLVAIMLLLFSGRRASEILKIDAEDVMTRLGLDEHLTPQRANGLRSMVQRIKKEATEAAPATG